MAEKNRAGIWGAILISVAVIFTSTVLMAEAQSSQLSLNIITPAEVNVCEPANYTIYINNTGAEAAHNITLNVTLPADFHYINGSTSITFPNGTSNMDPI